MSSQNSISPRTGRRGGGSTARDDILDAARALFGENGFSKTTLRAVAAQAGVDVALVSYYFGSKGNLFAKVMEIPHDPGARVAEAASGPREELGERLVRTFLDIWDGEGAGDSLRAMLRSAAIDERASKAFGDFASEEMMPLVARTAGLSMATARSIGSQLFGIAMMRYLVNAPIFTTLSRDQLVADFAPRLQAIIDIDDRLPRD